MYTAFTLLKLLLVTLANLISVYAHAHVESGRRKCAEKQHPCQVERNVTAVFEDLANHVVEQFAHACIRIRAKCENRGTGIIIIIISRTANIARRVVMSSRTSHEPWRTSAYSEDKPATNIYI